MRTTLLACLMIALLGAAAPVRASDDRGGSSDPRELAEEAQKAAMEAAVKILSALNLMIGSIPMYEAPQVLENGDIIIRRKRSDRQEAPTPEAPENDSREAIGETKT